MTTSAPTGLVAGLRSELIARLDEFFEGRIRSAATFGPAYEELWRGLGRAVQGGKLFRPMLVVTAHDGLGGTNVDDAMTMATAFELLHTAFLLHDDVIDHDLVRRGKPNLIGSTAEAAIAGGASPERARQLGENTAVLAGDLLIQAAAGLAAGLRAPSEQRRAVVGTVDACVFATAAGELADVAFSLRVLRPDFGEVMDMTKNKTAAYSFAAPLRTGAILAGADERTQDVLEAFGSRVGVAFQLRDDILGVFGDQRATGKSVRSDLRAAKVTPLVMMARQSVVGDEIDRLLATTSPTDRDCDSLRDLLEISGARIRVERLIDEVASEALDRLEAPEIPELLRLRLQEVVAQAMERDA